jgi:hypothetical protein
MARWHDAAPRRETGLFKRFPRASLSPARNEAALSFSPITRFPPGLTFPTGMLPCMPLLESSDDWIKGKPAGPGGQLRK